MSGTDVQDLTSRAKKLISERQYQEAVRTCRRVLLSRPDEVPVRLLLGQALLALRRYDEVRVEMLALSRKHSREPEVYRLLGESYLRTGHPDKAREVLRKALDLSPEDEAAVELLAEVEEEDTVASQTIDRWFDPMAVATIEASLDEIEGEATQATAQLPIPTGVSLQESDGAPDSVEIDPSLVEEASEITNTGVVSNRPSTLPPPPPRALPPAAGPPRRTPPGPRASAVPRVVPHPDSVPPPFDAAGDPDTGAHTPSSIRQSGGGQFTQELDLAEIESVEEEFESLDGEFLESLDEEELHSVDLVGDYEPLEGEPTRARAPSHDYDPSLDELDGEPTHALPSAEPLEGSPTVARPGRHTAPVGHRGLSPHPPGFSSSLATPAGLVHDPPHVVGAGTATAPARPGASSQRERPTARPPRRGKSGAAFRFPRPSAPVVAVVVGVVACVGIIVAVSVSSYMSAESREQIEAAVRIATEDGLRDSLDHAIGLGEDGDDDDASIALLARLHATAVLEHGADDAARADELLAELDEESRALPDAKIAAAYLALHRGDVAGAHAAFGGDLAGGEASETFRARALVAAAQGRVAEAVELARAAVGERPSSPRHVALLSRLMARNGDAAAALRALEGLGPEGPASPAVRLSRAVILMESQADPEQANAEATAVVGMAERATPYQRAWAHLVRARYAAGNHDRELAAAEAREAARLGPPGDELFLLLVVETFLLADLAGDASQVLDRMPPTPIDGSRRAALRAEVALMNSDLAAAETALAAAGEGARVSYLRGQLAELRGDYDNADRFYETAEGQDDGSQFVNARTRRGSLALARQDYDTAVRLLREAWSRIPTVELASMYAQALLHKQEVDEAQEVIDAISQVHPDAFQVVLARAEILIHRGRNEEAFRLLTELSRDRPTDPAVQMRLWLAALHSGHAEASESAFGALLRIYAESPEGLKMVAERAIYYGDMRSARLAIDRAREANVPEADLREFEGTLLVEAGGGMEAVDLLTQTPEAERSEELWVLLGRAYAQAERWDDAERAFLRGGSTPTADLGLAQVFIHEEQLGRANEKLNRIWNEAPLMTAQGRAQIRALQARSAYLDGNSRLALRQLAAALELDPTLGDAHLLRAEMEFDSMRDPSSHLRRAVEGRRPPPVALGWLATLTSDRDEQCDLARRYLRAAPEGQDAREVRGLRCN